MEGPLGAALLVAALALLTWPVLSVTAQGGLDPSWQLGLSLALSRGLAFGSRLVFTYGPLGLITVPRAVTGGTLALGLVGAATIQVALVALVLRSVRAREPLLLAVLATGLCVLVCVAETITAPIDDIAFGAVAVTLSSAPRSGRAATRLALAGGLLAALAMLVELDDGIAALAIVAVGVLGMPQARHNLALGAASFVASTIIAWLALGQPLGALPDYVGNGIQVVRGYVDAMGYDYLGAAAHWIVVAVIVSALLLAAGAWYGLRDAPRRARAGLAAAVLLVHYFVAREALVRFDPEHAPAIALLVPVAVMIPWHRRSTGLAASCAIAIAALAALGIEGIAVDQVFDPATRASAFVSQVGTMFSPGATIASSQALIRASGGLPMSLAAPLDGHCVDVEPTEVALVFANPRWRWCPVGMMQSYAAYTTSLDDLDARGFANAHSGPDRVIRELNETIDGRNPTWESPAAMLALLCNFREIGRSSVWQVLARSPDRCGKPRALGTYASDGDGPVSLPAPPPGMVVVADVHGLALGAIERLSTIVGRAGIRTLTVNGRATYRVLPDTVGDGLILDVPANADYKAPFNFDLSAGTLSAAINYHSAPITVTLVGVPIRPWTRSRG